MRDTINVGVIADQTGALSPLGGAQANAATLVADEIKVRFYGDTAIVTYRSTAKGKDQDGAIDEQRRWTRVFVRRDVRWQLVHSQGTTIQKP